MAKTEPEWLQGPDSGPPSEGGDVGVPTYDLMVETLRDLCGRQVYIATPAVSMSHSAFVSRGELAEAPTEHDGVVFTAGGGRLFLREEDYQGGERHQAEHGLYVWVTIRTSSGVFQLQHVYAGDEWH
jgi:hypothetical protein